MIHTGGVTRSYAGFRALVVLCILLAGCGWGKDDAGMRPTMTTAEAVQRVEARIEETVAQLPSDARLEVARQEDALPCDAPSDGGPEGRVIVEHGYWIKDLPSKDYPRHFEIVRRYWEDRGYRKLGLDQEGSRWVMVYTDADGFRLRLATSADGSQMSIRSQSPCIWPNGTPEPVDDPAGWD